jgi:hypothetical protein
MKLLLSKIDQLRSQLSGLNLFGEDAIHQIESANQLIRDTLIQIEAFMAKKEFKTNEEEIFFFRHIKPQIYSLQLAYMKILKIELLRPTYSKKEFKNFLKHKLDFVQAHYSDYPEFIRYYNSNQTYDDQRYFLRKNRIVLDCFPHFTDEYHSTGYDIVAAYMLAYKILVNHYDQTEKKQQAESTQSNISWTGDKVAFVELLSGLHLMGSLNMGSSDLKTLNNELGQLFNIDIKDLYGKRQEIKNRKGERFKFLHQMLDQLERDFDEDLD